MSPAPAITKVSGGVGSPSRDDELRTEARRPFLGGVVRAVGRRRRDADAHRPVAGDERGQRDVVPGADRDRTERGERGAVRRLANCSR